MLVSLILKFKPQVQIDEICKLILTIPLRILFWMVGQIIKEHSLGSYE